MIVMIKMILSIHIYTSSTIIKSIYPPPNTATHQPAVQVSLVRGAPPTEAWGDNSVVVVVVVLVLLVVAVLVLVVLASPLAADTGLA